MSSQPAQAGALTRLGIGKVLDELRDEFPDLTITKIRYLESEGLVTPQRTTSGYRKFSYADVERLRFVLLQQRDRYWPLSKIRQVLDDMDNGVAPPIDSDGSVAVPYLRLSADGQPDSGTFAQPSSRVRLSRDELLEAADIDEDMLTAAEEHRLVAARGGTHQFYDGDALAVAAVLGQFKELGIEPRHLRHVRSAADREISLIEQVAGTGRPHASEQAQQAAQKTVERLAALSVRLHTVLVRTGLNGSHHA